MGTHRPNSVWTLQLHDPGCFELWDDDTDSQEKGHTNGETGTIFDHRLKELSESGSSWTHLQVQEP